MTNQTYTLGDLDYTEDEADWLVPGHVLDANEVAFLRTLNILRTGMEARAEDHGVEVTITENANTESAATLIFIDTDNLGERNLRIRINDGLIYEGNPEGRSTTFETDGYSEVHIVQR